MSAKIKFPIIAICFFLAFLVMQTNSFAAIFILRSNALQTVFNQAEATYLSRIAPGLTTQFAIENSPAVFAQCVGLAMQRQFKYMRSHGDYIPQLKVLISEAESFMKQLARAHNYRHPRNGSNLSEVSLTYEFNAGLGGVYNQAWIALGIDPARAGLPFMLSQVAPPQNTGGNGGPPRGAIQVQKKNEINLFGNQAPAAESSSLPAPPKNGVVPEDILVGTWVHDSKPSITFFKKGNAFIATVTLQGRIARGPNKNKRYNATKTYIMYPSEPGLVFGQVPSRKYKGSFKLYCQPDICYGDRQGDSSIFILEGKGGEYYDWDGFLSGYKKR